MTGRKISIDHPKTLGVASAWTVEIVQELLPSKGHDRYLCRNNFLGVADGATPLVEGWPDPGPFAEFALAALADAANGQNREGRLDVRAVFEQAICRAADVFRHPGPTLSCALAVAIWHGGNLTAAVLGDCTATLSLSDGHTLAVVDSSVTSLDEATQHERGVAKQRLLLTNRLAMNSDAGYWIFSDERSAARHIRTVTVAADTVTTVVLETDGHTATPPHSDDMTFLRATPSHDQAPIPAVNNC